MQVLNFFKYKRKILDNYNLKHFCSKSTDKLKILFFGSDTFSLPSLKILYEDGRRRDSKIDTVEVITSFKAPINPVRKFALDNGIPLHKWPPYKEIDLNIYTIGIVVSFGYLIPSYVISKFPMGLLNLHASLLPRWRGAAPIVHAIANGDNKTGVTIMKVEPKHFDVGDILYQEEVTIESNILMPHLHDILATKGAKLILKTVQNSPECFQYFKKQNEDFVSYAPKVSSAMAQINWEDMKANEIYNLYRALYGYKSLSTKFNNFNLKIIEMTYSPSISINKDDCSSHHRCGFVQYHKTDNILLILCKNKTYIQISKLKIEGKKVMTALDFNNGYLKKFEIDERYFK